MLSSLDALAGKISPGSGKNSPPSQQQQQQQQQQQGQETQQESSQTTADNNVLCHKETTTVSSQSQLQQSKSQQQLRLNGNHHNHNFNGGLDTNCNKLSYINHNTTVHHPYKQTQQQQQQQQQSSPTASTNTSSSSLSFSSTSSSSSIVSQIELLSPIKQDPNDNESPTSIDEQQFKQQQQQHELFDKQQLQQQQQQHQQFLKLIKKEEEVLLLQQQQEQLQHQQQQQHLAQEESMVLDDDVVMRKESPRSIVDETDSQLDAFKSCLKDNVFGMSDKSSTTNSLPNSPIHTNNNNSSLLNNNNLCGNVGNGLSSAAVAAAAVAAANNNNNNNNICSANRNVVIGDDDSSCYRMDTDMLCNEKEPDPDNIKMFVGQVPKSMDEAQLREMFEEYGPVHSINVLRDKATGISKGCCFVTFYTRRAALKAQDALHNVKTLSGMYHPIQMKPADSENRNERKLFVGMLNKKLNENDVRKLFEVHGAIEECTVLRDQNGQSKGCAFVTFATKHAAISAIKVTLNQNKTMEGCTSPLVVKFADTQKEKEQKKYQQIQANLWNLASNMNIPLGQTATTVSTPILPNPPQQASPVLGADAITPTTFLLQQLQAVGLQQQLLQGVYANEYRSLGAQTNTADTAAATAAAAAAGLLPPMTVQNLAAIAAMAQPSLTNAATNPGTAQLTNTAALLCLLGKTASSGSDPNPLASAYMSTAAGLPQFGSAALTTSPLASVALSTAAAAAAGKQIEGPEGCNLFIYHLPQEFTDTDLASTFIPFGNVISAKVFIDKQTNLSKCFGFVSFDNTESAQVAIKAMNGFQVGTKRLKVQLKKPKDASKPY